MNPFFFGVTAVTPNLLHIYTLTAFLDRFRIALNVHIHPVQPSLDKEVQGLSGHIAVSYVSVVQTLLPRQREYI